MDLTLHVPPGRGIAHRLYGELRKAVLDARLQSGDKLPSSRELATQLDISRNTVTEVYERLAREGFFEARHGSGTFVTGNAGDIEPASVFTQPASPRLSRWARELPRSRSIVPGREMAYDFRPGLPDLGHFPIATWRRLAAQNLRELSAEVGRYGDPAGLPRLRTSIARYLSHSRAVLCSANEVLICSGSQQALDLLGRILIEPGATVAMEDPGYPPAAAVFRSMGARVVAVRVDDEGVVVDELPKRAKLVYVTPSHQFPLGVTLSLARRKALLGWARERGAVIIEDDYDSEFRFGGRALESLQGLDRSGTVVYLGTFSKVLFPGLRLGYVVVPPWLREPFLAAKWITDRHSSALEQCIMADFIARGHFGRHLKRMQRLYRERQRELLSALGRWTTEYLSVLPSYAGLHLTAMLPRPFDVEELLRRAYEAGVGLYSIAPFYIGAPRPGLIFGFAPCSAADIHEGVRRLAGILRSLPRSRRA